MYYFDVVVFILFLGSYYGLTICWRLQNSDVAFQDADVLLQNAGVPVLPITCLFSQVSLPDPITSIFGLGIWIKYNMIVGAFLLKINYDLYFFRFLHLSRFRQSMYKWNGWRSGSQVETGVLKPEQADC